MTAKHRKASKLAAQRAAIAASAISATAGIGMMGAPAQAATTAPDYSRAIADYSHALDNLLNAANNVNGSAASYWGPIASGSGGLLPTFGSTYTKADATKIADLPKILNNLGTFALPTGVPGVVPDIILPGGGKVTIPLPTTLPGGKLLVDAGAGLQKLLDTPVIGDVLKALPAGSDVIKGLEITQSKYSGFYDFAFLGINGQTVFTNTFAKTPSGLTLVVPGIGLNVPLVPEGTLPSGTLWVPQGNGTYNFPLGGQLGWWGAMPTGALKLPGWLGGSDTVIAAPIYAAGAALPLNAAKVGVIGGSVLLPTKNGVYSPIGATVTNLSTFLPFGLTNLNVTTGNYIGTNGINLNNGQNLSLLQNPLGIPLPLIYGLGGVNFGVNGAGLTSPSLFGIKLFSDNLLQVGKQAGPDSPAGLIPPALLPTDPISKIITGITSPLGVSSVSQFLGVDTVVKPVMTAFGPVWATLVTPVLKPLSDLATEQYGPFVNRSASSILDLSKTLSERSEALPVEPATSGATTGTGARAAAPSGPAPLNLLASAADRDKPGNEPAATVTTSEPRHAAGTPGTEPAPDLFARLAAPTVPSGTGTGVSASSAGGSGGSSADADSTPGVERESTPDPKVESAPETAAEPKTETAPDKPSASAATAATEEKPSTSDSATASAGGTDSDAA
ncbi:hypothetical protein GCM10027289_06680 [Tsukamurella serpentis]